MPDLGFINNPNRAERPKRDSNRARFELRPLRYSTADVTVLLRCTRVFVHKLIKAGALRAVGSKRKLWITADSLEAYLASLPDWQP
jgi:hypothetical protein